MTPARDPLSDTFGALADPTRRAILARLATGSATIGELAEPFRKQMSLPAITKHVQVLERAGMISKSKNAQWRSCSLKPESLAEASSWLEQYKVFWEESFDRLEAYLKTVHPPKKTVPTKGKKNARRKTQLQ